MLGIDTTVLLAEIGKKESSVITLPVGQAVVAGDIVSVIASGASAGQLRPANSLTRDSQVVGLSQDTAGAGGTAKVSIIGHLEVFFNAPITAADLGSSVYLGPDSGEVTLTAPSATGHSVIFLGYLQSITGGSAGKIVLNIQRVADL